MAWRFDLFGDRTTSLKVNVGPVRRSRQQHERQLLACQPGCARRHDGQSRVDRRQQQLRSPTAICVNRAAQDLRAGRWRLVRRARQPELWHRRTSATRSIPRFSAGWGIRPADWQFGVSIQREMLPRVSAEFGYDRRWLQNFVVTDNRAVAAIGLHAVQHHGAERSAAARRRWICRVRSLRRRARAVRADGQLHHRREELRQQYQVYNGLLLNVSARPRNGLTLQGSINAGKTVKDACEVRNNLPELTSNSPANVGPVVSPTNPFCRSDPGFVTRMTAFGSYIIPKIDVQIADDVQERPGRGAERQLRGAGCGGGAGARQAACGRPAQRHGEPRRARRGLGRSRQRARPAHRQGAPVRAHARQHRRRHLQCVQLGARFSPTTRRSCRMAPGCSRCRS